MRRIVLKTYFYCTFSVFLLFLGCSTVLTTTGGIRASLVPTPDERYTIEEDGFVAYDLGGLKISVKAMDDEGLNNLFPEISYKKEASTNPYTYGDWRDPELGYTPNRFTVFIVRVNNRTFPKVNLDPRKVSLTSNRGDQLESYGRDAKDEAAHNFEDYYLRIRGASGVDKARFEERMGIVRQTLFTDGQIFKGDSKEGMLAFDPLHPAVKTLELTLVDFVLEYDANNWPSKTQDFVFKFNLGSLDNIK